MSLLSWIIAFSVLGGVLSVLAAAGFLMLSESVRSRLIPHLISFAIGVLLSAAFMGLLPHALEAPSVVDVHQITMTVLVGLLAFFLLEKLVLWRHCHHPECEVHAPDSHHDHRHQHARQDASASLVLIGDGFHNFVDGVLIAAAFMTDVHLGIVTALAVAAHEIPQEVGDFAILLRSGYSTRKALLLNILASMTTVVGALLAYVSLQDAQQAVPYVLAVAAASFIYIAVADLIPGLHDRSDMRSSVQQVTLILLGVLAMYAAHSTLH